MICQACGHSPLAHNLSHYDRDYLLEADWVDGCCLVCRHEQGGPCFPWEFR